MVKLSKHKEKVLKEIKRNFDEDLKKKLNPLYHISQHTHNDTLIELKELFEAVGNFAYNKALIFQSKQIEELKDKIIKAQREEILQLKLDRDGKEPLLRKRWNYIIKRLYKEAPRIILKLNLKLQKAEQDKNDMFKDKIIEARLCSCDAIQNLKIKDADNIAKHKKDCIYVFCKKKYGDKT